MITMYERLTKLREQNKLSQTEVAHALAVTPALISAYEKGDRNPSLNRLVQLADLYQVSTDYILGRTTSTKDAIYLEVTPLTDTQINVLRTIISEFKGNKKNKSESNNAFDSTETIDELH